MIIELVKTTALLLALCLLQGFNVRAWGSKQTAAAICSGLLFGGVCVIGMMMPIQFAEGVIFDARSVVLSMAGLFGGALVGGIAAVITAAYRLWLGGAGAPVGVVVIGVALTLGLAYRYVAGRGWVTRGGWQYLLFGVLVHLAVLFLFTFLPRATVMSVFSTIAVPYLVVLSIATALLGLLLQDLEDRRRTERALVESEARMRAIASALPDLLMVIDEDGRHLEVISSDESLLHTQATEVIGRRVHEVLPEPDAERFMNLMRSALEERRLKSIEYELDVLGGRRMFEGRCQPLESTFDGKRAVLFLARDITAQKRAEDEIRSLAFYDPLTQLPNRRLLMDRLLQALAGCKRSQRHGALMFVDLDDFKNINDRFGHQGGDLLLQQVAGRLSGCVRQTDTVARFGGDEFVIMLEELDIDSETALREARVIAEKALDSLNAPYPIAGQSHPCGASIGIAMFGESTESVEPLLKQADLSMYASKHAGKGQIRFYDHGMEIGPADERA